MIKLSEFKILEDALYKAETEYSKESLYNLLSKKFSENRVFSPNTIIKLKQIFPKKDDFAHERILANDFAKIIKEMKLSPKEFDESVWENFVPDIQDLIRKNFGLEYKPRAVFFRDRFPEGLIGFEKKGASSVTLFEGQEGAGVYFLNKRLSSLFSPIIFIHEQLHSCLSQNKNKEQIYIEWFEEGLCQWYSLKIFYELTKNLDIVKYYRMRSHLYSLVQPEYNFTKRYFEYMKIFSMLFLKGGPKLLGKMLNDYLSNERDKVNEQIDFSEYRAGYLPKDEFENELLKFTFFLEPEKVMPLEYVLLKAVLKPKTVKSLVDFANAPIEVVKKSLFGLQLKGMIVFKGKYVEINWRKKDLLENGLVKPIYPFG